MENDTEGALLLFFYEVLLGVGNRESDHDFVARNVLAAMILVTINEHESAEEWNESM